MVRCRREGQLLVKRFAVDPKRPYGPPFPSPPPPRWVLSGCSCGLRTGEMAGLTCCVFYFRDRLVELEPIGPLEDLAPG